MRTRAVDQCQVLPATEKEEWLQDDDDDEEEDDDDDDDKEDRRKESELHEQADNEERRNTGELFDKEVLLDRLLLGGLGVGVADDAGADLEEVELDVELDAVDVDAVESDPGSNSPNRSLRIMFTLE